jgi:hypothetical protein
MSKERALAKWQSLTYSPKLGCSSESVLCCVPENSILIGLEEQLHWCTRKLDEEKVETCCGLAH